MYIADSTDEAADALLILWHDPRLPSDRCIRPEEGQALHEVRGELLMKMNKPDSISRACALIDARKQIEQMREQLQGMHDMIQVLTKQRFALAKLSATGPAFLNPLEAMEAESIRDEILNVLDMNPDGTKKR